MNEIVRASESEPAQRGIAAFFEALPLLDRVGLGIVAIFFLLGVARGLWWQVIRLAGLSAAALLARTLAPRWSPALSESSGLPPVAAQGLAWFAAFVLGLAAASLLGLIGKKSLETMQLGLVDRFGGAIAGVLTGLLLHTAALLGLSYLGPQPWTQETLRGSRSQTLLRLVSTRLPVLLDRESQAAREIRAWLGTTDVEPHPTQETGPVELAPGSEGPASAPPGAETLPRPVPVEASAPRGDR